MIKMTKTRVLSVRVTESDYAKITAKAEALKIGRRELFRRLILMLEKVTS